MEIVGYTDRLSVEPGQKVSFMVSSLGPTYRADIVRLIHGDDNPLGPGFKDEHIVSLGKSLKGTVQTYRQGSHVLVKDSPSLRGLASFTVQLWMYPTTPKKGEQAVVSRLTADGKGPGYAVLVDARGRLAVRVVGPDGRANEVTATRELRPQRWYFVAATYDGKTGRLSLTQSMVAPAEAEEKGRSYAEKVPAGLLKGSVPEMVIAARPRRRAMASHYNGKLDGVKLYSRALTGAELKDLEREGSAKRIPGLVASWDFARDTHSARIRDSSGNGNHGETVNFPMRAVTGHNWSGHELDFKKAPSQYDAIYFHDDDLGDAGWKLSFEYKVPTDAKSGVYAAWLRTGRSEDYVPFFVRPRKGKPTAKIALLLPTLSYLAYAEEHALSDPNVRRALDINDSDYPRQVQDVYAIENSLLGLYDRHSDGTGVCYTSRLRPITNMRPKYVSQALSGGKGSPHQLNEDLHLADWMEAMGYKFDVITDEDLDDEGKTLLSQYRVVVTGSHPEYWTERMMDSMLSYLNEGGRMMYLGGNGFYWVTEVNPENPYIFEVRRWGGTGTWMAEPGEYYNSFTGKVGGLWRNRGRHPQKMVGVGFTSQGFDVNKPYRRQPDSRDPRVAFIFEGIGRDELIGDHPSLVMASGAAGYELDRLDFSLGTPSNALLLATASGFSDNYQHVIEENTLSDNKQGGTTHPQVRADMVYVGYPNGGAVFSVGAIAWCGSLSYGGYKNSVSRVTGNVLTRFSAGEKLPSFDDREKGPSVAKGRKRPSS